MDENRKDMTYEEAVTKILKCLEETRQKESEVSNPLIGMPNFYRICTFSLLSDSDWIKACVLAKEKGILADPTCKFFDTLVSYPTINDVTSANAEIIQKNMYYTSQVLLKEIYKGGIATPFKYSFKYDMQAFTEFVKCEDTNVIEPSKCSKYIYQYCRKYCLPNEGNIGIYVVCGEDIKDSLYAGTIRTTITDIRKPGSSIYVDILPSFYDLAGYLDENDFEKIIKNYGLYMTKEFLTVLWKLMSCFRDDQENAKYARDFIRRIDRTAPVSLIPKL